MALAHTTLPKVGIAKISYCTAIAAISGSTVWTELFYTLKGTFAIAQDEPTKSEIKVSQLGASIYSKFEPGAFMATAQIPDTNKAVLDELFSTDTPAYAPAGHTAVGVSLDTFVLEGMFKVDYEKGGSFIITNGQLVAYMTQGDGDVDPLTINISITALNSFIAGQADVIFYNPTDAAVTYYTWVKYGTSSSGAGLSDTLGANTFIGIAYNKTSAVESTNPADYIWTALP